MTKYIPLDDLVAEIEKLKKSHDNWSCLGKCFHQDYEALLSFINTLEVKEVDFKNVKSILEGQYLDKDKVVTTIEMLQDECEEKGDNNGVDLLENLFNKLDTIEVKKVDLDKEIDEHWNDWAKEDGFHFIDFAKHFFELGLKVRENRNLDDIKREWYNKGYLKGRKEAHIPARELGLPKDNDFHKED